MRIIISTLFAALVGFFISSPVTTAAAGEMPHPHHDRFLSKAIDMAKNQAEHAFARRLEGFDDLCGAINSKQDDLQCTCVEPTATCTGTFCEDNECLDVTLTMTITGTGAEIELCMDYGEEFCLTMSVDETGAMSQSCEFSYPDKESKCSECTFCNFDSEGAPTGIQLSGCSFETTDACESFSAGDPTAGDVSGTESSLERIAKEAEGGEGGPTTKTASSASGPGSLLAALIATAFAFAAGGRI